MRRLKFLAFALAIVVSTSAFATPKRFISVDQFNSDVVLFAGKSAIGTAAAGDTVNIDYTLDFDALLTGATLIVKGGKSEDKASLQIVHPSAGVLNEFVTDWYIAEDQDSQFSLDLNYPANLASGLIVRLVYKAKSGLTGTRTIRINYMLHKVLQTQ